MDVRNARIHIAGSAAATTVSADRLRYAHSLIAALVDRLARDGAAFVVTPDREPRMDPDDETSPAVVFDWTILEAIGTLLQEGHVPARTVLGKLATAVVTEKTDSHIPPDRRALWEYLAGQGALRLEYTEPGWTFGGIRRQRAVREGTLFIPISGGQGVDHYAQEYLATGKPVIPLDIELGSSTDGPHGRAVAIAKRGLAEPSRFVELEDPATGAELLAGLATRNGDTPAARVVDGVVDLIRAMKPPRVFYVRLLNNKLPEYPAVERYFRTVVDPVVEKLGYCGVEMGHEGPTSAWMNAEIFERLHHAQVVLVDLTGLRNNCFMEMGYAFGHQQPVLIVAQEGTHLPFDSTAIDSHMWSPTDPDDERARALEKYWRRTIDRPALVKSRSLS
ncbi:MAG TPA: hypothetical protein VFB58_05015 [Chloroflexota bacterium]|nr:hypothetical protein [Chloroflexota bacterium]